MYEELIKTAKICCGDIPTEYCTAVCINPCGKRGEDVRSCRQWLIKDLYTALTTLQAENAEKDKEIERLKLHKRCASCGHDLAGDLAICRPCANELDDDIKASLFRVEAERDEAISDVPHDCEHCKHATGDGACKLLPDGDEFSPDYTDGFDRDGNCDHWEWRGAQGEG